MSNPQPRPRSPVLPAILSALIPGLGQGILRRWYRGVVILLCFLIFLGITTWFGKPFWYFAPIGIWLWNIWDATGIALKDRPRSAALPVLLGIIAAFGIGWQVVEVNFAAASIERAMAVARPMAHPDFIERRSESTDIKVPIQVPCPLTGTAPKAFVERDGMTASISLDCAGVLDELTVTLTGAAPNAETRIWWETAIGDPMVLGENEAAHLIVTTDEIGSLTTTIRVPTFVLIAQPDPTLSLIHKVHFTQTKELGGWQLSVNGGYVVEGMLQTITMALMATTLGLLVAIPISFLAARNLMSGNPVTFIIYLIVRTLLNIVRSIEALIIAIVFVVIVGLGPFAGVMAMAVHTVAALAKLYSEVIEGIDPGPIEAIRSTGANWVQVVRYGVIPQIIPPFTAFTIYRWDINIRSSTIIGFVGGGGIGFYLVEWIRINDWRGVSAAFIAIAVVVMLLDFLSAKVRERLV